MKTERVFFTSYKTREEARRDIVDYIEMFYNSNRRHSSLVYLSQKEFEESWLLKKPLNKSVHFYLTGSGNAVPAASIIDFNGRHAFSPLSEELKFSMVFPSFGILP